MSWERIVEHKGNRRCDHCKGRMSQYKQGDVSVCGACLEDEGQGLEAAKADLEHSLAFKNNAVALALMAATVKIQELTDQLAKQEAANAAADKQRELAEAEARKLAQRQKFVEAQLAKATLEKKTRELFASLCSPKEWGV